MTKLIKQLFCKHEYQFKGHLCGVEDCFECTKCGKRITTFYRNQIEKLWKRHEIELDFNNDQK